MKTFLTDFQKKELEKEHRQTRDGRVRDRIKAVLLASEGWSSAMIAQALRISQMTVDRHLKDYFHQDKLKPQNGGSDSNLSTSQTAELIQHLEEVTYSFTNQIVDYVESRFGIRYTVSGMTKWLCRNNFSYKRCKGIPHHCNEEKQEEFIKFYEELKANKKPDEVILFMDAVHPTQATKISSGWIRKGKDKIIETTGSRTRLNVIGALNLSDIGNTVVTFNDTVDSHSVVMFFHELRKHYPPEIKLNLMADQAGYNKSQIVRDCAYVYNIELHYLPTYSPNLNPIERLWKVMNEKARNNVYFKSKREFVAAIKKFFSQTLPEIAEELVTRITDNFQRFQSTS